MCTLLASKTRKDVLRKLLEQIDEETVSDMLEGGDLTLTEVVIVNIFRKAVGLPHVIGR